MHFQNVKIPSGYRVILIFMDIHLLRTLVGGVAKTKTKKNDQVLRGLVSDRANGAKT